MNLRASFGLGLKQKISCRFLLKSSKQKCWKLWGLLGGGNSNIFDIFTPKIGGRCTHFDVHIFQMGWFNHQLVWKFSKPNPKTSFLKRKMI